MTKQEIKDLIAAKIAGQGCQLDLEGAVAAALDAIVDLMPDAGLVVEGSIAGAEFTPGEGQPSFDDAVAAYNSGAHVVLIAAGAQATTSIIGFCDDEEGEGVFLYGLNAMSTEDVLLVNWNKPSE